MASMRFPEFEIASGEAVAQTMLAGNGPVQEIIAINADNLIVSQGINRGEALMQADRLCPGDSYRLSSAMTGTALTIDMGDAEGLRILRSSGQILDGKLAHFDAALTFISPTGQTLEALTLIVADDDFRFQTVFLVPLATMRPGIDYCLIEADTLGARTRFAQSSTVSFIAGTPVTLADGSAVPVEAIRAGQHVRTAKGESVAIGMMTCRTTRASGAYAPLLIRKGTLGCEHDLMVSPDHRILVRSKFADNRVVAQPVLVRARHLVNGRSVIRMEGGFVDYHQLVLDRHDLVCAGGLAVESSVIDAHSRHAFDDLPSEVLDQYAQQHGLNPLPYREMPREALARADAVRYLEAAH